MGSKCLVGFLITSYSDLFPKYANQLVEDISNNKLKVVLDFGQNTNEGKFEGIDSVVRGVEV